MSNKLGRRDDRGRGKTMSKSEDKLKPEMPCPHCGQNLKLPADATDQLSAANARIKELEKEIDEQCRLNGMGAQREARLEAKVKELEGKLKGAEEALEHCRNRPHEHNPPIEFILTECEVIDRALAQLRAEEQK
jgi:septal ring factor EnvC (AmiA/AmiB activator)